MSAGETSRPTPTNPTQMGLRAAIMALSLVGVLAVGIGVELFKLDERTTQYQADLERSIDQRSEIRRLATALHKAEAAQRGFLLTRNPTYELKFDITGREIAMRLAQLPDHFTASEAQSARASELYARSSAYLASLAEEVDATRMSDQATLQGRAAWDIGEMDRIGMLIDQMISFEEGEIIGVSQLLDAQFGWSRTVVITLLASIMLLVGGVLGVGVVYLSHRGRAELRLQEATEFAEKANRVKSEFLASMSHEIRTPLTGILGYTELLLGERLTEQQRQFVERLETSSAGLLALVNDILDFSKIEAGELTLERESLSLKALIADVMSIVAMEARRKQVHLTQEIDPAVPERVIGDALRLRQVLLNLLGNAVKFTEKGSVTLRATHAGTSPSGELIRFEVHDTGIGIPREQRDRLFRRFSQIDGSIQRRYGGTGLGLAISKRLVELMEGDIGVESEPGRGSTFWVTVHLPRTNDNGVAPATGSDSPPWAGGRILLAEDSPQNQDLVATVLRRAGHQVDIAGDGEEALVALRGTRYDLILMDMQMPRMDGITATRRIRDSDGPERDVPIIAMTANVQPEHLQQFSEAGANDHISKPFRITKLAETVGRWLGPARMAGHHPSSSPEDLPTHDPAALDDARELMGVPWVRTCLSRLESNIGRLIASGVDAPADLEEIRRLAHQTVGDAGQLGFVALSRRCSELEEACARDGEIDLALDRACQAGRLAIMAIASLMESRGED